jgi:hypothetical protein
VPIVIGFLLLLGLGMLAETKAKVDPPGPNPPKPKTPTPTPPNLDKIPGYKPAKLNYQIIEIAKAILKKDNPLGTMTPFELNGKKYIARDEIHDHPPRGPHHGVSVYEEILTS